MGELESFLLHSVGEVRSRLARREDAPRQAREGAPDAWLEIYPQFAQALEGVTPGCEVVVLTWLHMAKRDTLKVVPHGDRSRPLTGVFATRSPDRPNPIGLHRAKVLEIDERKGIRLDRLEAIDGTPILDIKPVLPETHDA